MSDQRDQAARLDALFRQIQAVLAGHSEMTVLQALMKSLVVVVGVSSPSLPRAEALLDALPAELKPVLRAEWDKFRRHRAKANLGTPPAERPN